MQQPTIAFIGAGHLAQCLIQGLVQAANYPNNKIWATARTAATLAKLRDKHDIYTTADNKEAAARADIIFLTVLPHQVQQICNEIVLTINPNKLVISAAAGVPWHNISTWLHDYDGVIRCMPNTPVAVGAGAIPLYAPVETAKNFGPLCTPILNLISQTVWLTAEDQFNAATALSGCGPAYVYLVMEALQSAAEDLKLDKRVAKKLTLQTIYGAAKMAKANDIEFASLRRQVAPPGGVTEQAVQSLENNDIRQLFATALNTAKEKIAQLEKNS